MDNARLGLLSRISLAVAGGVRERTVSSLDHVSAIASIGAREDRQNVEHFSRRGGTWLATSRDVITVTCALPVLTTLKRSLAVCCALALHAACLPPPGAPSILQTPVTGEWSGTFESSWGALPVRMTLSNVPSTQTIEGSYVLDGGRATGSLGGALQTTHQDSPGLLQGSLTISYTTSNGQVCRSASGVTSGSATSTWFAFQADGFPTGNCPDPPRDIRVTLRR